VLWIKKGKVSVTYKPYKDGLCMKLTESSHGTQSNHFQINPKIFVTPNPPIKLQKVLAVTTTMAYSTGDV
jgi:hypothetical protein